MLIPVVVLRLLKMLSLSHYNAVLQLKGVWKHGSYLLAMGRCGSHDMGKEKYIGGCRVCGIYFFFSFG